MDWRESEGSRQVTHGSELGRDHDWDLRGAEKTSRSERRLKETDNEGRGAYRL